MIRRATMKDLEIVRSIMTDERVYSHCVDDGCPPREEFDPTPLLEADNIFILLSSDHAFTMFERKNFILYDMHACLLPEKGRDTIKTGKKAINHMFTNTGCEKIMVMVPECNPQIFGVAKDVGFIVEGVCSKSFKLNGKLYDQILMGICKEDWLCRL